MPDLIQFVDSIDAAPTVRLDLNDEASFWVKSFSAPPPRLRRSMASNAMRDGINVGSSSYDSRTLTLEVECRKASQDAAAVEMQKLWREMDRPQNFIRYQPQGASKPVFFRTFRSDASQLADVVGQAAMRTFTIEVLAEPFALGLKETLGPYAVNNDPAAASNPCYVSLAGVLGDVASPVVYWDSTSAGSRIIASTTTAGDFRQAESVGLNTDTTNPGGGPDAAMSGTGTNNFARTSFATDAAMVDRLTVSITLAGSYRVVAVARLSSSVSTISMQGVVKDASLSVITVGETVPLTASTLRQAHDLGVFHFGTSGTVGPTDIANSKATRYLSVRAARASGTATVDWDCLLFIPADDATQTAIVTAAGAGGFVLDGEKDRAWSHTGGDPTAGTAVLLEAPLVGAHPTLRPGATTRLYVIPSTIQAVGSSTTVTLAYWPRYLFVRPVST